MHKLKNIMNDSQLEKLKQQINQIVIDPTPWFENGTVTANKQA